MAFEYAIIIGVCAAIAGAIVYACHRADNRRTEQLRRVAAELGFEFFLEGDPELLRILGSFDLLSLGTSPKLGHLMRGVARGLEVAVFDYHYVTHHGKSRRCWYHSVICFRAAGPPLPTFSLRPRHVGRQVGRWFGYQAIEIESRPRFSKLYLLRGDDENAVRKLLTEAALDYCEDN